MRKLVRLALVLLVLGLALGAAERAEATIPSCLQLIGTATLQGTLVTRGDVTIGRIRSVRISSRDVISLLGEAVGQTFSARACLEVDPDGPITVVDGANRVDVSEFVTVDFNFDVDDYFSGTFDAMNLAERSLILFLIDIAINVPAANTDLTLTGLASEFFNAAPERGGSQRIVGSIRARVSGRGNLDGEPTLFEGTALLQGRGDFPVVD